MIFTELKINVTTIIPTMTKRTMIAFSCHFVALAYSELFKSA
jgi:hypothetical protein